MKPSDSRKQLHEALLQWYAEQGRPLLWRRTPGNPYQVLVREVMLQQTQVARVERLLPRFLERFPTVQSLAAAPLAEVIRWWQGLGYNRRARLLWECARRIVEDYGGVIPSDSGLLMRLPGIGRYTAAAVATFAFGRQDVPVVDTNIARVLQRLLAETLPPPVLLQRARELIPPGASVQWHEALMDLGALYCRKRRPLCGQCPLRSWCRSAGREIQGLSSGTRREPHFQGVPRRLWRGRLLRLVAAVGRITLEEVAAAFFHARPTPQQRRWLRELIAGLVRDGLLQSRRGWLMLPQ
jgi:A/G-specific adenine glycosylase